MATTTNYAWTMPTVGADTDVWGGYLNTTIQAIDTEMFLKAPKASPAFTGTVTSPAYSASADVTIKPGANSTTAVKLQNAAGTTKVSLDTTNDRVAIGPTVPGSKFEINGNTVAVAPVGVDDVHIIGSDAGGYRNVVITGITQGPCFIGRLANGTGAAPSAATNGNYTAQFQGRGYLAAAWSGTLGRVAFTAEENYTGATAKTAIVFETTAAGAVSSSEKMRLTGAGQLALGTSGPAASAAVDITSTTGAVLLPRMTTAQRDALTAVNGMILYNSTTNKIQAYQASGWVDLA